MVHKIKVSISAVSGEPAHDADLGTHSAATAREFLERVDHEGSSVLVTVEAYGDDAYKLLDLLEGEGNPSGE